MQTRQENKTLVKLELEFEDHLQGLKTDPRDIDECVGECEVCHMKFIFASALKKHMKSHEIKPNPDSGYNPIFPNARIETKFICSCCKKQYFDQGALDRHTILHNNPDGNTFTCIKCRDVLSSKEELIEHTIEHAKHDQEDDACCLECGSIFCSKKMLDIHMRIHFGKLPFKCTDKDCSKKFPTANSLESHQKKDHYFEYPHQCIFCLESFLLSKK